MVPVLIVQDGVVTGASGAATSVLGACEGQACAAVVRARADARAVCRAGCPGRRSGEPAQDVPRVRVRGGWWRLVCDRVGHVTVVQMLSAAPVGTETLSPREREILAWIGHGGTTREIARRLGIQPGTVRTHVERVLGKLGVHTRAEAVACARDLT